MLAGGVIVISVAKIGAWHMANHWVRCKAICARMRNFGTFRAWSQLYYLGSTIALPSMWAYYTEIAIAWSRRDVWETIAALVGVCAAICFPARLVGPIVTTLWRTAEPALRINFGTLGFAGVRVRIARVILMSMVPFIALWGIAAPAIQSLMARHVDAVIAGKTARSDQFVRAITAWRAGSLYADFCACDIATLWPPFAGSTLLLSCSAGSSAPASC